MRKRRGGHVLCGGICGVVEYRVRWNQGTVQAYLLATLAVAAVLIAVAADGAAVVGDEESTKADAETTPYSNCNEEEDGLGGNEEKDGLGGKGEEDGLRGKGEEVEGKEDGVDGKNKNKKVVV